MDRSALNLDDLRPLLRSMASKGFQVEFIKEDLTITSDDSPIPTRSHLPPMPGRSAAGSGIWCADDHTQLNSLQRTRTTETRTENKPHRRLVTACSIRPDLAGRRISDKPPSRRPKGYDQSMLRLVANSAATFIALALVALLSPTPAVAVPVIVPQAIGTQLEEGNIVLIRPGETYQVQLAGQPAEVTLLQTEVSSGTYRNQLNVNGSMVREFFFSDNEATGEVFLVQVTASDTLIYQHGLIAEGEIFLHSVVFRFDGKNLVDATKLDDGGDGVGWFALDQAYDSKAGAGKIVTKFGGITNTCNYVSNELSCAAKLPRPTFSGHLKVGKKLTIRPPQVGTYRSYLWYRCNAKGKSCRGIAISVKKGIAATKSTYRLSRADKRKKIKICADYGYEHWADWVCSNSSAKVK